jgi:hypothetical protein
MSFELRFCLVKVEGKLANIQQVYHVAVARPDFPRQWRKIPCLHNVLAHLCVCARARVRVRVCTLVCVFSAMFLDQVPNPLYFPPFTPSSPCPSLLAPLSSPPPWSAGKCLRPKRGGGKTSWHFFVGCSTFDHLDPIHIFDLRHLLMRLELRVIHAFMVVMVLERARERARAQAPRSQECGAHPEETGTNSPADTRAYLVRPIVLVRVRALPVLSQHLLVRCKPSTG